MENGRNRGVRVMTSKEREGGRKRMKAVGGGRKKRIEKKRRKHADETHCTPYRPPSKCIDEEKGEGVKRRFPER